jgi:pimeloyl-ACP methyl ester carboxylesterase
MASNSIPESSPSKAFVPSAPLHSQPPATSDLERSVGAVFKHSVEDGKTAAPTKIDPATAREAKPRHLYQVLPALTGIHSVGYTSLVIEGPKNTHSVGDSKIGIEIYAPTKKETGNKVPLEFPGDHLKNFLKLSSEQIQTLQTHSHDQIDPIEKPRILIFSHGLGTLPIEYRLLLEELTSHGYLVLSLNHPSSSGYAPFSEATPPDWDALNDPAKEAIELERLASAQAENIRHVVGLIRQNSGVLGKHIPDTGSIVLAGHSLGGAASIIAAQADRDIACCIDLDGALLGKKETRTAGLAASTLIISSDHRPHRAKKGEKGFEKEQQIEQDFESFLKNPSVSSQTIDGINHMDFCLGPVLHWLRGDETLDNALKAHRVASREMVRFMNSILST